MRKSTKTLCMLAFAFAMLFVSVFQVRADDDVRPKNIYAVGKKSVTVYAGSEFDLKVRMTPRNADEDALRWKITSGSKFVRFDDDDLDDDEIELKAVKAGTAKVRCSIKGTGKKVIFTVKVKKKDVPEKITNAVKLRQRVEAGDDFELKVKKYAGLQSKYLKWEIQNKRIVRFGDDDRTGTEAEFEAVRTGNTTITCKNAKTGQKITFTITVVRDSDDNDDDYDRDEDD